MKKLSVTKLVSSCLAFSMVLGMAACNAAETADETNGQAEAAGTNETTEAAQASVTGNDNDRVASAPEQTEPLVVYLP